MKEELQLRCRDLLIQVCDAEELEILKVVVSSDYVHLHIEYSPKQSISFLVKQLKGRSLRKLQLQFPQLGKMYWGRHFFGRQDMEFGVQVI